MELIENLLQLLTTFVGALLSGIAYRKSQRQAYFLLLCFYGCFALGALYWTLYLLLFDTIEGLKRMSKPGRRVYVGAHEIPRVQNGLGICILSTSHGVLAGDKAHQMKVGGQLLCEIW